MRTKLKLMVRQRAKYCCEYCIAQERFTPDNFSGEHIIPVSKGGTDDIDNLALACQRCNNLKYTFTHSFDPGTGKIVPLYNPRTDDWDAHFRWDETFTLIIGLSPTGRATVKRLELNRESLINFRNAFRILGLHPPY